MENRNRVIVGAPIASLGMALVSLVTLLVGAGPAEASQRYLCTSVPRACEYAGPDAPVLAANVCWNGSTTTLMGSVSCPTGSRQFWAEHGSIDPLTGAVEAYIALDDACKHGWCSELSVGTQPPTAEGEVCCHPEPATGACTLAVTDCAGEILWCENYSSNGDGTVDCTQVDE